MHVCKAIVFENHARDHAAFASITQAVAALDYEVFGITKTLFATHLTPAAVQLPDVTDYLMVQRSVVTNNRKLASLIG